MGDDPLKAAFDEHYTPLLRLLVILTGQREMAEDIAQDAFIRSASRIEHLGQDEVGRYLRRVGINLWKNKIRRAVIEQRFKASYPVTPSRDTSVEERDALWQALEKLPHRQRACLVLRFYEDLSVRTTAEILGCSVGSVKSQTSRALDRLRKEVEADED